MKIITELMEANKLLQIHEGATLQIWMFSPSLKRMALRLTMPEKSDNVIYVVGISCESINGQFYLPSANLFISTEKTEMHGETITKITDSLSKFELVTSGGFTLVQGPESEFGRSFEEFLVK